MEKMVTYESETDLCRRVLFPLNRASKLKELLPFKVETLLKLLQGCCCRVQLPFHFSLICTERLETKSSFTIARGQLQIRLSSDLFSGDQLSFAPLQLRMLSIDMPLELLCSPDRIINITDFPLLCIKALVELRLGLSHPNLLLTQLRPL